MTSGINGVLMNNLLFCFDKISSCVKVWCSGHMSLGGERSAIVQRHNYTRGELWSMSTEKCVVTTCVEWIDSCIVSRLWPQCLRRQL